MHATSHSDIPDMIHLGDLTEGAICRNIFLRYKKDKIYVNFSETKFSRNLNH
jgi:myosin heavy subunit